MLKNKTSIFAKIALVIALLTPMIAQADIMATLAMKAAQSYAERAVHDTEMQNKLIEMVKNDQGFKERLQTQGSHNTEKRPLHFYPMLKTSRLVAQYRTLLVIRKK